MKMNVEFIPNAIFIPFGNILLINMSGYETYIAKIIQLHLNFSYLR